MENANGPDPDQIAFTLGILKKQLHKKQNLGKKSIE